MIRIISLLLVFYPLAVVLGGEIQTLARGRSKASSVRPPHFPHRIWAACDFDGRATGYEWFGSEETNNIPVYPGNKSALRATARPYQDVSAIMNGLNPVPGPRMGKVNSLFIRYFLKGGTEATFQYFSLTKEDNQHIIVEGLTEGKWSEVTMNFTQDARRNDGSSDSFGEGERMDDLKIFAGKPAEASRYELVIDDVIFFSNDPTLPPENEVFPNRVIFLAAFDTGPKEKYWPGDFDIIEEGLPADSYWRVARAVPRKDAQGKLISLPIDPPRTVGAHTKLRFRYYLTGSSALTVQIFDASVQDNRHIDLTGLPQNKWSTVYLDFLRESKRNDGTPDSQLSAGHKVDDLFFFVAPKGDSPVNLMIDEVVLYDAAVVSGKAER